MNLFFKKIVPIPPSLARFFLLLSFYDFEEYCQSNKLTDLTKPPLDGATCITRSIEAKLSRNAGLSSSMIHGQFFIIWPNLALLAEGHNWML